MKTKRSKIEYSDNYIKSNPNTRKYEGYNKQFDLDEFMEIVGEWLYTKLNIYFEDEK